MQVSPASIILHMVALEHNPAAYAASFTTVPSCAPGPALACYVTFHEKRPSSDDGEQDYESGHDPCETARVDEDGVPHDPGRTGNRDLDNV